MSKKRILKVLNWDKFQARSDKELPWLKLWGSLFKRPWFMDMREDERFATICILDMARQFNNKMTEEMLFKTDLSGKRPYLCRIYDIFMDDLRLFNLCKVLSDNEFLSDLVVGPIKSRVDKSRVDIPAAPAPLKIVDPSKQIDLTDIPLQNQTESVKHKVFNFILSAFRVRGWKDDAEYVKRVFKKIVEEMEGYSPKDFYPYFQKVTQNHINRNAELYSADARIVRGKEKKIGVMVGGMMV